MKIGSVSATGQQTYEGSVRTQGVSSRVTPQNDGAGLSALGSAIARAGKLGTDFISLRTREEEERQNFEAVTRFNRMKGELAREVEGQAKSLPADGAGYTTLADASYGRTYQRFKEETPEWLHERFNAQWENVKQSTLLATDDYTRGQTRGNAILRTNEALEDAKIRAWQNPDADVTGELRAVIEAAPGLTALERADILSRAQEAIAGASFGGRVQKGYEAAFVIANTNEVTDKVVPAVILAESGGNPNAESPVGASGLMQVMPGTGTRIASELNDDDFPFMGTEAEKKQYLKNPYVSERYGTYYLNQQLSRFGGDLEAALIAYNAGPGNAQKFLDAGRDYEALPKRSETEPYVTKIMGALGALRPEDAFDPKYGLTLEQAISGRGAILDVYNQAASQAQAQISLRQKQDEDRRTQMLQQLFAQAEAGKDFEPMYIQAVEQNLLPYNQADRDKGRAISDRVLKEQREVGEAYITFAQGGSLTAAQGDMIIGPELREGLLAQDQGAMQATVDRVGQMGFVPNATENTIRQMLNSPDMGQAGTAAQMIYHMKQENPGLSLPDDLTIRAKSYQMLRDSGMPADQIAQRMAITRDPDKVRTLKTIRDADDAYKDNSILSAEEISTWNDSWVPFTGETSAPLGEAGPLLQLQYRELFDAYYDQTGDAEAAKTAAMEQIGEKWSPTETGGQRRLMYLAPERALTNMKFDIDGDGQLEQVKQTPAQARRSFNEQVKEQFGVDNFAVMGGADTERALAQGGPVPYTIIPLDEEGQPYYDFTNPATMDLLTGRPLMYNFGTAAKDQIDLIRERENLQDEMDRLIDAPVTPELGGDPTAERRFQIQNRLDEIGEALDE